MVKKQIKVKSHLRDGTRVDAHSRTIENKAKPSSGGAIKKKNNKSENYKGYKIDFRNQWDAIKQIDNYSVQIYDKEGRFFTGFFSDTKAEGLKLAKNLIDREK
jgi:hypothetical protein